MSLVAPTCNSYFSILYFFSIQQHSLCTGAESVDIEIKKLKSVADFFSIVHTHLAIPEGDSLICLRLWPTEHVNIPFSYIPDLLSNRVYEIVTRTVKEVSTYSQLNAGVPWQDKMENHRNGLTSLPVYRLDLRDSKPLSECVR